jgi:hypothetical protein
MEEQPYKARSPGWIEIETARRAPRRDDDAAARDGRVSPRRFGIVVPQSKVAAAHGVIMT